MTLFNPRSQTWNEHFACIEYRIVGLTEIGRATVMLLDMNDPDRIQLRAELSAVDEDVM